MKKIVALLLVLVILLTFAACSEDAEQAPAQDALASDPAPSEPEKAVLRIGSIEASQSFSPTAEGSLPMYLAYEFLCRYNADGSITNWCAESIDWTDDTTLVIKLRDGIFFQNGEQMLGEDVLYSLDYIANAAGSMLSDKFKVIDFDNSYVEADGLTVVVKLQRIYSVLTEFLPKVCLTDKSQTTERASDDPAWWDKPISSSAYEIVENIDGAHVTFRLRDDYWDKENMPAWDEIVFYYYTNATSMFIAFENGELDLVSRVDVNDYDRAVAGDVTDPDATTAVAVGTNSLVYVVPSGYCEYFQDAKVREALAHAVDPDAIGITAFGSLYRAGQQSVLPAAFSEYYAPQGLYEYDLEYAKQCMAESAYPDGFTLDCITVGTDALMWEVLQAELAELGIAINLETYDFASYIAKVLVPDCTDICLMGSASAFGAFETISSYSGKNALTCTRVLDESFNELFDRIPDATDEAEKVQLFADLQKRCYESFCLIPLFEPCSAIVYNNRVVDCHMFSTGCDYVQYSNVPVK